MHHWFEVTPQSSALGHAGTLFPSLLRCARYNHYESEFAQPANSPRQDGTQTAQVVILPLGRQFGTQP
jgi:hypothetical protein